MSGWHGSGGGGGYTPGSQGSANSPSGAKASFASSLRPVTIRQIIDAQEVHVDSTEFRIDGSDATQVTFTAQVLNVVGGASNVNMKVIDGTGSIEVRLWMGDSSIDADSLVDNLPDMCWVRIVGHIRNFQEKRMITAASISRVVDHNEIFYSQLEALQAHLYITKGPLGENGQPGGGGGGAGVPSAYTAGGATSGEDSQYADLPPVARRMLAWIKDHTTSDDGVLMTDIARGIRDGANAQQISEAIDYLQDNGYIYAGVDDDHFIAA
ncbi:nucleic acid-binding protein [Clavulina sp. PMI_390]|nr:nucleic acid-binding protein [Clavulina sp. PMI_390]